MRLEYQLTLKDYLEANQAHLRSQRSLNFFFWGLSIFFLTIGLLYLIVHPNQPISYLFVALGIGYIPFIKLLQRHRVARAWKSQPSISEPRTLEATDKGLTLKAPSYQSALKWQAYTHFVETQNLFVVYQSNQAMNMFPKRAFFDNEQVNKFRELLRTRVVRSR